jgi:hypothetical protein
MPESSAAHRRQQRQLRAVLQRDVGAREMAVDRDRQVRFELGDRGMRASHGSERIGHAAAVGQLDGRALAARALARLCEEENSDVHLVAPLMSLYARRMDPGNQEGRPDAQPSGSDPIDPRASWRGDSASNEASDPHAAPSGDPSRAQPHAGHPSDPDESWREDPTTPSHSGETPAGWEFATRLPDPAGERAARGLGMWLLMLGVFGAGGLLLGMEELAAMVAIAGLFVLSQAADIDPRWRYLHYSVSWVVPACGLMVTILVGYQVFVVADVAHNTRMMLAPTLLVAAIACVASALRPVANVIAQLLFQVERPSHTLRLGARITLVILALALPGWYALRTIFDQLFDPSTPLLDRASLEGQLIGYILLALAAVGFLIRRDWRSTLERLGLTSLNVSHLAVVAIGVVALYGINAVADWVMQTSFHDLWEADHQVNEAIASGLSPVRIAVLGLSAGIGEEITLRGALQPKLGLVMTSLLFASLHLQYSWFGMAVIFLLGMLLGIIRMKTNTTAVMAVHAIYDVVALFTV